jgi:hypothetical protein
LDEETRVLFVAFTRARKQILHVQPPSRRGYFKHESTDRWVKGVGNSWQRFGVEVKPDDTSRFEPAGVGSDPRDTQAYLSRGIKQGDSVELVLLKGTDGRDNAEYAVKHGDRIVGTMSPDFCNALYRILRINSTWQVRWPESIQDLFVESVDTVAGPAQSGRAARLGSSGLWLRVRVYGLGRLSFRG